MLKKIFGWVYVLAVLFFFYLPVLVLMGMSFNESRYGSLPFNFSTMWYESLWLNQKLMQSAANSILLALLAALICVLLATALVLGEDGAGKKLRALVNGLIVLPLLIPWLILGLSLLLLQRSLGIDKNYLFLIMGHVVVSFPYAYLVISTRHEDMNREIVEASYSLGANAFTTFRRITMPMLAPGMIAGGFLSFMISFDNFVTSYFLIPTGDSTLPIEIYSSVKFGFTPEINAISTIILISTMIIITVIAVLMRSTLLKLVK
ncbi:MAG: ABC transporter permease [Anaerolineae bacterium]|nr:ABC transporter permease [Anaerolineae bacterium]